MNKNTEVLVAEYNDVLKVFTYIYEIQKKENASEEYIKILENKGINNVREKLENMFILDYLILNEDRHLNNFGIIRNVNNLNWIDIAPIFNNGQSLNILDYNEEELIINSQGRFFYNVYDFDFIISKIKDIKRIDLSKLDGVVDEFDELLHKYQSITRMTDRRINKICTLLISRINKLENIINT